MNLLSRNWIHCRSHCHRAWSWSRMSWPFGGNGGSAALRTDPLRKFSWLGFRGPSRGNAGKKVIWKVSGFVGTAVFCGVLIKAPSVWFWSTNLSYDLSAPTTFASPSQALQARSATLRVWKISTRSSSGPLAKIGNLQLHLFLKKPAGACCWCSPWTHPCLRGEAWPTSGPFFGVFSFLSYTLDFPVSSFNFWLRYSKSICSMKKA